MSEEGTVSTSDEGEFENLAAINDEVTTSDVEIKTDEEATGDKEQGSEKAEEPEKEEPSDPEKKTDAGEHPEEKEKEVKKPRKNAKKRIDQLTYEKYQAQRERDAEAAKRAELEKKLAEITANRKEVPEIDTKEPKEDEFKEYSEYIKALSRYESEKRFAELAAEREAVAAKKKLERMASEELEQKSTQVNEFKRRLDDGGAEYEDFEEVVFNNKDLAITPEMVEIMKASDHPAEIAYAFGKNPSLALEVAQMNPTQMALKMGKLDVKASKMKKPTKAPDPIKPVTGSGVSVGGKDPDKMSPAEYQKWRMGSGA